MATYIVETEANSKEPITISPEQTGLQPINIYIDNKHKPVFWSRTIALASIAAVAAYGYYVYETKLPTEGAFEKVVFDAMIMADKVDAFLFNSQANRRYLASMEEVQHIVRGDTNQANNTAANVDVSYRSISRFKHEHCFKRNKTISGCPAYGSKKYKQLLVNYVEYRFQKSGYDNGVGATIAYIESGLNPTVKYINPKTKKATIEGAAGLFQYTFSTARSNHGLKDQAKRYNVIWSLDATLKDFEKYSSGMNTKEGLHLYLAHQQGFCGQSLIKKMAETGSVSNKYAKSKCGHTWSKMKPIVYRNMLNNTYGKHKRHIRSNGALNKSSAKSYLAFWHQRYKKSYNRMMNNYGI